MGLHDDSGARCRRHAMVKEPRRKSRTEQRRRSSRVPMARTLGVLGNRQSHRFELALDQSVKITVSRGGSEQDITATIGKRTANFFAG